MATLGDLTIQQPTVAQSYRFAAEQMLAGALALQTTSDPPAVAVVYLCGHGTEVALKALLAQSGQTDAALKIAGHKLTKLWQMAIDAHLLGPSPRPQWVDQLDRVHGHKYILRYPLGINMMVLPDIHAMAAGLEQLVATVKCNVH